MLFLYWACANDMSDLIFSSDDVGDENTVEPRGCRCFQSWNIQERRRRRPEGIEWMFIAVLCDSHSW